MTHLIELKNVPIFEQLQLEEALLRTEKENFLIINFGSPRAIVMGISSHPEKLIDIPAAKRDRIPVIKRFSGGGTVIIDENTLFVTFIMNKDDVDILPFPEPILQWGADLYSKAWQIPHFQLRENDYCIGEKKCGGNAQYIQKDRWLLHTSFLWDYEEKNMEYLRLPEKQPKYRHHRSHTDFLTRLKEFDLATLIDQLKSNVKPLYIWNSKGWKPKPHRQSTQYMGG
jgi:lipoate-protein ligase A